MPTLLEKGKIVKQKWMPKNLKDKIDNEIGINFLIDYINDRCWEGDTPPNKQLRGIGDKVLILRSGTGSGKSTLLPPFLYKKFLEKGGNLIITQPTKATTTSIPDQIIQYNPFLSMGDNIGYQTGSIKKKPIRGVLFATYGILLQHLKILTEEEFMNKYRFVIIDEVHSRTIDIDLCLYYLKILLKNNWDNPKCPFLILTSATFDEKIFMNYFECKKESFLDVLGATFPRYVTFKQFSSSDYIKDAVNKAIELHEQNTDDITNNEVFRDILIFVQGSKQMSNIAEAIHFYNYKLFKSVDNIKNYLCPILANSANIQSGKKDYRNLFVDIRFSNIDIYDFEKGKITNVVLGNKETSRRIVLGTNAIETGLTIDTLKYCIDTGFVKESSFNPVVGCQTIVDKPVTKASSEQRKGRVGRKSPGWFYPIYTEETWKSMIDLSMPDIIKEDITPLLLSIIINSTESEIQESKEGFMMSKFDQKKYKLVSNEKFFVNKLDFIQPPSALSINYSVRKLHGLGFIDRDYNPTIFGMYANKFRKISMENIRLILAGYHTGANIMDLITVVAFLEVGMNLKQKGYKSRNILNLKDSVSEYYTDKIFADDIIEYLFIWYDITSIFEKKNARKLFIEYCKNEKLSYLTMLYIIDFRDELLSDMLLMGLDPYYNSLGLKDKYNILNIIRRNLGEGLDEIKKIKECIYEGYRFNIFTYSKVTQTYTNLHFKYTIDVESELTKIKYSSADLVQKLPSDIIVTDVIFKYSNLSKKYTFSGNLVSVLDGYVIPDKKFLSY